MDGVWKKKDLESLTWNKVHFAQHFIWTSDWSPWLHNLTVPTNSDNQIEIPATSAAVDNQIYKLKLIHKNIFIL